MFWTSLVAARASEGAVARAGRPGYPQIAPLGDPITSRQLEERRAVEGTRRLIVGGPRRWQSDGSFATSARFQTTSFGHRISSYSSRGPSHSA
jgi:hypothetical protein